jgi:hypothetical protein
LARTDRFLGVVCPCASSRVQGITAPVTANVHVAGTGLGAAPAIEADAIGSQRAAAARMTRMRFEQIGQASGGPTV